MRRIPKQGNRRFFLHKSMENLTLSEKLYDMVEALLADTQNYVIDLQVKGAYNSPMITLLLDSDEGISVDECMRIGKKIKRSIEAEALIEGYYGLEVSSPGATRPLEIPRQYKKHIGRDLKVKFRTETGYETIQGILERCSEDEIVLLLADDAKQSISFDDIVQAKVVLPW